MPRTQNVLNELEPVTASSLLVRVLDKHELDLLENCDSLANHIFQSSHVSHRGLTSSPYGLSQTKLFKLLLLGRRPRKTL